MNIFSNIGITELVVILLLALLVVGPERLPELARQLGKTLRDVRRAYENLTRDLGPELTSIQQSTKELRDSVESVRAIPDDLVKSIVKAADLDESLGDIKNVAGSVGQVTQTLSETKKMMQHPVDAAVKSVRNASAPPLPLKLPEAPDETQEGKDKEENEEQEEKSEIAASVATEQSNE